MVMTASDAAISYAAAAYKCRACAMRRTLSFRSHHDERNIRYFRLDIFTSLDDKYHYIFTLLMMAGCRLQAAFDAGKWR